MVLEVFSKLKASVIFELQRRRHQKARGTEGRAPSHLGRVGQQRGPCSIFRRWIPEMLPTGMVRLLPSPWTLPCKLACLPLLTRAEQAVGFIFLLLQMCFSSESVLKYNVYYLYFLFYVLHKFSVMVGGCFFPKYSKEHHLHCFYWN